MRILEEKINLLDTFFKNEQFYCVLKNIYSQTTTEFMKTKDNKYQIKKKDEEWVEVERKFISSTLEGLRLDVTGFFNELDQNLLAKAYWYTKKLNKLTDILGSDKIEESNKAWDSFGEVLLSKVKEVMKEKNKPKLSIIKGE